LNLKTNFYKIRKKLKKTFNNCSIFSLFLVAKVSDFLHILHSFSFVLPHFSFQLFSPILKLMIGHCHAHAADLFSLAVLLSSFFLDYFHLICFGGHAAYTQCEHSLCFNMHEASLPLLHAFSLYHTHTHTARQTHTVADTHTHRQRQTHIYI